MVERVLILAPDSTMPNVALMKLSASRKAKGDVVDLNIEHPTIIYASIILKKNSYLLNGIRYFHPKAKIVIGGLGYSLDSRLPCEIEFLKPDYDLFLERFPDADYSLGYTTRGCNRLCPFCWVPQKEGRFQVWQHPREFYDDRFSKITFLDNNILFDKPWFFEVMNFCEEQGLRYWFTQGLDIRLLDERVAQRLREVNHFKMITFAWDFLELENIVREKIRILEDVGFNLRKDIMFYVYLEDDSEFDSALYRIQKLKEWGSCPYLMPNIDKKQTKRIRDLRRYANRKWYLFSCDFEDFRIKKNVTRGGVHVKR